MTNQITYDHEAILPVLKDMLNQESDKTKDLSEKLITIGELAVASSLVLKETQEDTKNGHVKLDTITGQQEKIVGILSALEGSLDNIQTGSELVHELRSDFRAQLEKIIQNHTDDKDAILEYISNVYSDYTNRVIDLSTAINTLNETLTNPEYKERTNALSQELKDVKVAIDELRVSHEQKTKEQFDRIESLIKQLSIVDESFSDFVHKTSSNQEVVTQVVQHVNIIEDRLDALLTASTSQNEVEGDK